MPHAALLLNIALTPAALADDAPVSDAPVIWGHGVARRQRAPRQPALALALSLTGTLGSGLLVVAPTAGWLPEPVFYAGLAGAVVAPSLGHLYTGERDRAYFTSSLRLLSAGIGVGGAVLSQTSPAADLGVITPAEDAGRWMMLGSGVLIGGIALVDVFDSPFSARRISPVEEGEAARTPALLLTPTRAALVWDW